MVYFIKLLKLGDIDHLCIVIGTLHLDVLFFSTIHNKIRQIMKRHYYKENLEKWYKSLLLSI